MLERNDLTSSKSKKGSACKMCGQCCRMEIPLTLLDICRIAKLKGGPERNIFNEIVQEEISKHSSLFTIRKQANGSCLFLKSDNKCSLHLAKPNVCQFYSCSLQSQSPVMPWTATCTNPSQRIKLWEQSIATTVTKAYIDKNGPVWNKIDYPLALKGILENIQIRETQKVKLGRNAEGLPIVQIYDCLQCDHQGTHACETLITLDDIRRIAVFLEIPLNDFFETYLDSQASTATGCLKLKRNRHCIFFNHHSKGCSIEKVKPLHCRFTPCPKHTSSPEIMDAFYPGSRTIEEQFRYQISLAVTRDYVSQSETLYSKHNMDKMLKTIDKLIADGSEIKKFCRMISPYRYVDDTFSFLESHPTNHNI